ncbi:MAG: hypothetical protein OIF57_09705 [Marinobacterium sp.]|nr:hypothetical protein [Marinobacterium sp.]
MIKLRAVLFIQLMLWLSGCQTLAPVAGEALLDGRDQDDRSARYVSENGYGSGQIVGAGGANAGDIDVGDISLVDMNTETAQGGENVAKSFAVDLHSGMPVPVKPASRRETPYPYLKAPAAFRQPYPWLQLKLDKTIAGRLASADVLEYRPAVKRINVPFASFSADQLCATNEIAMPLDAGPRQNWITRQVSSLAGDLWQRWFGDEGHSRPLLRATEDGLNSLPAETFLAEDRRLQLSLRGVLGSQGLQLSTRLSGAEDQPGVHLIFLERRDCQRAWPDKYQIYGYWSDSADQSGPHKDDQRPVEWQKSDRHNMEKQNTALVLLESGAFQKSTFQKSIARVAGVSTNIEAGNSRKVRLSRYQTSLLTSAPPAIWQQLGYSSPERGVNASGSHFSGIASSEQLVDAVLVIHIARAVDRRYLTEVMLFRLQVMNNGQIRFRRI